MKIIYVLLTCLIISSCSKDDDGTCNRSKFVGQWTGTAECNIGGNSSTELVITEGADGKIELTGGGGLFQSTKVGIEDCKISNGNTTGEIISGELSNQTLTIRREQFIGFGFGTSICNFTLTKK